MKKYKVFVDSNGKDSLWFHRGDKVENHLALEKQETPKQEPSVEELNGEILMSMFNLTGLLKKAHYEFKVDNGCSMQVTLEEQLSDNRLKRYVLDIRTVDVKEVNCSYTRSVKPELQPDGSYWK